MLKKTTALGTAFLLLLGTLWATSVKPVNLQEMVGSAERIFWGSCVRVEETALPSGLVATQYTFQVRRGLKGVEAGEMVTFRQLQSTDRQSLKIPGLPTFRKGQESLIFLYGESRLGLTSPVGLQQGVFRVEQTEQGLSVINALENSNLDYDLPEINMRSAGLAGRERDLLSSKQPIPLDTFAALVAKFDRLNQQRADQ
ncbi:MAG TPA: hypothetical protein VLU25_12760 [Acidobacteriota bacterium]|nr:hypothetical protein [Acidobacteriota bacterium]